MNALANTKYMSRADWLKLRTLGLGGSDASIIAGCNKYKSIHQLWLEKTGKVEPIEVENDYVFFGHLMEPIVKQAFYEKTGLKVRARNLLIQSKELPFVLANIDGIVNDGGEICIFEAKNVSEFKRNIWEQGPPIEYQLQCQHYLYACDLNKAHIAAVVGGNSLYHYIINRDEQMISDLISMERQFWEENVLKGIEPEIDGLPATTMYLNEKYKDSNGTTINLPEESLPLFQRYEELSNELDELKLAKEGISNQLKNYLKDNEKGIIGSHIVSWKEVQTSRLDTKRFKEDQPKLYDKYKTVLKHRRLYVS